EAIVTVPLPLIKTIAFIPPIPDKLKAASEIGFGSVIKILMRFHNAWWKKAQGKNFEKLFFLFSNETIPSWWTQYPEDRATLTGWKAGPTAEKLSEKTEAEIEEIALQSLSNIFKMPMAQLQDELITSKIIRWSQDPYAKGAYSYPTPESTKAIEELLMPVDGRLFFAGEAINSSWTSSTVEGALASGLSAAQTILKK
ncbi:FAD-dependent oxidoreductase, partial [Acetobacteraceae bacterium]|nr:FAD-dependent oxidoreductase [Candidatus Parcubacteria bacterium]